MAYVKNSINTYHHRRSWRSRHYVIDGFKANTVEGQGLGEEDAAFDLDEGSTTHAPGLSHMTPGKPVRYRRCCRTPRGNDTYLICMGFVIKG